MNWEIEQAKNGQSTLKLNGIYLYSKYDPEREVIKFLNQELKKNQKKFLIIGLGLGYHIQYILKVIPNAEIQYILLDEKEERICNQDILLNKQVNKFCAKNLIDKQTQIIIPQSFLSALNKNHSLYQFIEDIKIRQVSYERFKNLMAQNFYENLRIFSPLVKVQAQSNKAALVSSGPSLNETIHWLKKYEEEFDIYCVGSALKILLNANIVPKKVFMIDAQDTMIEQICGNYSGDLVCLSTANYKAIKKHLGIKQIIFQEGYELAEDFARKNKQPLFETGGSVATTAFSFIKWIGYESLYLFGQDLGFTGRQTHASFSTSGREADTNEKFQTLISNDGTEIFTTSNLASYKRWFDREFKKTSIQIYNTAKKGAFIEGTKFFDIQ